MFNGLVNKVEIKTDLAMCGHYIHKVNTYADIKIIILIGSFAIVIPSIAADGPNAIIAHPKNSMTVILLQFLKLRNEEQT